MMDPTHDPRPAPTLGRKAVSNPVGRDAPTNLDALAPIIDDDSFFTGLDKFVAEMRQAF